MAARRDHGLRRREGQGGEQGQQRGRASRHFATPAWASGVPASPAFR
jgi:hypothetical protein